MPIRVYWRADEPFVDWCFMGGRRFTEPFFDITIEKQLAQPFSLLFRHQTRLESIGELIESDPGLAPSGFVFHMSRCGSTLVAQMLAALEKNIVLSEPPPLDSIIRANGKDHSATDDQRIKWLRWMVGALGRKRAGEKFYFIKFDSWSMLDLDLVRRAFPEVPWIFLYRHPVEVLVSQLGKRGVQMIPGAIGRVLPGIDLSEILEMPPEEYCARVLAGFCQSAIEGADEKALFVNYEQLPGAVTSAIVEHFGVEFAPEEIERIERAARFDAKTPQMTFAPDGETKRKEASPAALRAAEKWLDPLYRELEKMRLGKKQS